MTVLVIFGTQMTSMISPSVGFRPAKIDYTARTQMENKQMHLLNAAGDIQEWLSQYDANSMHAGGCIWFS